MLEKIVNRFRKILNIFDPLEQYLPRNLKFVQTRRFHVIFLIVSVILTIIYTCMLFYEFWEYKDKIIPMVLLSAIKFQKGVIILINYLIEFLCSDSGPIMPYWTVLIWIIEYLYEAIDVLTVFYFWTVALINNNYWVFDWMFNQLKICVGFNATYGVLLASFFIYLVVPDVYYKIGGKKGWYYMTWFILLTAILNMHYVSPLQFSSDSLTVIYKQFFNDPSISISPIIKDDVAAFTIHTSRKIGLIFCLLVAYIFVLVAYVKQIICTKREVILYISLEYFLLKAFSTTNLLEFYIFFEAVLIPMYLLIIGWGSGEAKKTLAAYYLVFYTVFFSIPFLISVLYLGHKAGSYDIFAIKSIKLDIVEESYILLALFIGFAVKVPMFPFHIWLPEAHVNAPTTASVILASLLLKLGGYGMIVFLIPICKNAAHKYQPWFYGFIIISIIYAGMAAIVQTDTKRIIAYSSISHMNLAILGIFSWNPEALQGAIYQMLSHGITSAGLFFLIGFIYDRHHTRDITYYGGLATVMPLYSTALFFFTIANMGFPGTSSFVGELLIFIGVFKDSTVLGVFALIGALLSAVYSIWLFNRMCFGTLKTNYLGKIFFDLNRQEFFVILYLLLPLLVLGFCPNIVLDYLWFIKYYYD